jgi:DNA-binding transcriptional ArsR family regulator
MHFIFSTLRDLVRRTNRIPECYGKLSEAIKEPYSLAALESLMIRADRHHIDAGCSEQHKAKATARMIYYAAFDADELGLGECGQLLHFVADLIRVKYGLQDQAGLQSWSEKGARRQ